MKPLFLIICLFFSFLVQAQETEIFTFGTSYQSKGETLTYNNMNSFNIGISYISSNGSLWNTPSIYNIAQAEQEINALPITMAYFKLQYPFNFSKKRSTITPSLFYGLQHWNLIKESSYYGNQVQRIYFHQIDLGINWQKQFVNKKWASEIDAFWNLNTNFKDFKIGQSVLKWSSVLSFQAKEKFRIKAGLKYISFYDVGLFPLIGFDWQINNKLSFNCLSFDNLTINYRVNKRLSFGLESQTIFEYFYTGINPFYQKNFQLIGVAAVTASDKINTEKFYSLNARSSSNILLFPHRITLNSALFINEKIKLFSKLGITTAREINEFYYAYESDRKINNALVFEIGFSYVKK